MSSKAQSKEKFKSKIGGQAVIEGVMMRGIHKAAMACRLPDGTIDLEEWAIKGGKDTPWYRKTPFVRGIFSFLTSLIDGYKCLTRSAEKQMAEDDEEEQTKFEQWLDDKLGLSVPQQENEFYRPYHHGDIYGAGCGSGDIAVYVSAVAGV